MSWSVLRSGVLRLNHTTDQAILISSLIVMVGTMGALTAAGAKATVQGTFFLIWIGPGFFGRSRVGFDDIGRAKRRSIEKVY